MTSPKILAIVGMPGSGKSEMCKYLKTKEFEIVRFGDLTEIELKRQNLEINPQNEQLVRVELRKEKGMNVYAVFAMSRIQKILAESRNVVIDGLYSWDEYLLLKKSFPNLVVINVFAGKTVRYQRLAKRGIRPLSADEAQRRDYSEIETLQKGGPIAIADYTVDSSGSLENLRNDVLKLLEKLK